MAALFRAAGSNLEKKLIFGLLIDLDFSNSVHSWDEGQGSEEEHESGLTAGLHAVWSKEFRIHFKLHQAIFCAGIGNLLTLSCWKTRQGTNTPPQWSIREKRQQIQNHDYLIILSFQFGKITAGTSVLHWQKKHNYESWSLMQSRCGDLSPQPKPGVKSCSHNTLLAAAAAAIADAVTVAAAAADAAKE